MKEIVFAGLIALVVMSGCRQKPGNLVVDEDIHLIHLRDSVYMHVTWDNSESYGRFSSNGMVIIRNGSAILVDTPMDKDKTERLVNYLEQQMSVTVEKLIPGHYHDDCMGGMPYLHERGVLSIANILTAEKCRLLGQVVPQMPFIGSFSFDHYGEPIECRYFGGGHTEDNIVVWLPRQKILFGGCLVKSAESSSMGNVADAMMDDWDETIRKIIAEYPDIDIIVPGHGNTGGKELLTHTIGLVEKYRIN
jgi:metallo-beta-lactamase class B